MARYFVYIITEDGVDATMYVNMDTAQYDFELSQPYNIAAWGRILGMGEHLYYSYTDDFFDYLERVADETTV